MKDILELSALKQLVEVHGCLRISIDVRELETRSLVGTPGHTYQLIPICGPIATMYGLPFTEKPGDGVVVNPLEP